MLLQARQFKAAMASLLAIGVAGCSSVPPTYDKAIPLLAGPAPTPSVTRMEDALRCVAAHYPRDRDIRLAVNDLTDGTGATMDGSALAKVLTQRPDVMMTIGLAKTGVRLVNRSSTGVAEWEIRQAMQKYIGDGRTYEEQGSSIRLPYRPVMAGAILGSTHYVSGAITELNWNVYSTAKEAGVGGLSVGKRQYRISVAVDLIVTDSRTTEIVMARTYSKQLVGQETAANLFRFFDVGTAGKNVGPYEAFEFNLGKEMNEPVQTAVRWILETAAYDIVTELSGMGPDCDALVPEQSRRQRTPHYVAAVAPAPAPVMAPAAPPAPALLPSQVALPASVMNAPAPAPEPAAPMVAGGKTSLSGINLFADEGAIIARVDTDQPMRLPPVLVANSPHQLVFDLPGVHAEPNSAGDLSLGRVRSVVLDKMPDRVRVILTLKEPVQFSVKQRGKSSLIILTPAGSAPRAFPDAKPAEPARAPSSNMLNGMNASPVSLEPKRPAPLTTPEQVIPIIQP